MAHPPGHLSWQTDVGELKPTDARRLRDAADSVAYWLTTWNHILLAALPAPIEITLVAGPGASGDVVARYVDEKDLSVRLAAPMDLIKANAAALRSRLIEAALSGVEQVAQRQPPHNPAQIWRPQEDPVISDTQDLAITLELMETTEMVLFGRLDAAGVDNLARFHDLDDYVLDRVSRSGAATVVDTEGCGSAATWTIDVSGA